MTNTGPGAYATVTITCTTVGHWHHGRSALLRDPGHPVDPKRVCGLIDLAYHPVLSTSQNVRNLGPWRNES